MSRTVALAGVASSGLWLPTASADGKSDAVVPPRFEQLDNFFQSNPTFFPNGVVMILIQDGDIIFRQNYHGFDESTPTPIASSTKWISALAICSAIVDPAVPLAINTPVATYVPSFAQSRGPDGLPDKGGITLAHAFAHTSGLPNTGVKFHRDSTTTHAQAVAQIAQVDLIFDPGEAIHYGGFGMHAAGLAVANALQTDWAAFMYDELFGPLGMTDTDYDAFTPDGFVPTQNPNVAGSIRTTPNDYARFLLMLNRDGRFAGNRVVDPAAIDLMLTDYAGPSIAIDRSPYERYEVFVPNVGEFRTGFGCFVDPDRVSSSGDVRWATSAGAYGTNAFIDLDRKITGVMFTFNDERWASPVPGATPDDAYNPSSRAFLEAVRPLIETAIPVTCDADTSRDGRVDGADLLRVINAFGQFAGPGIADPTSDGAIDGADLLAVLNNFGTECVAGG